MKNHPSIFFFILSLSPYQPSVLWPFCNRPSALKLRNLYPLIILSVLITSKLQKCSKSKTQTSSGSHVSAWQGVGCISGSGAEITKMRNICGNKAFANEISYPEASHLVIYDLYHIRETDFLILNTSAIHFSFFQKYLGTPYCPSNLIILLSKADLTSFHSAGKADFKKNTCTLKQ